MQAYRIETTVQPNHTLTLDNLPFLAGERVEVISYGEQHPNAAFRRRTRELRKRSIAGIECIILLHAKEIRHPKPERAVNLGLQLIALSLKERILPTGGKESAPLSDEELARELSRMLLGYLRYAGRAK